MRTTRLGKTGLQVSVVALGTWAFGGDWDPSTRTRPGPPSDGPSSKGSHCSTRPRGTASAPPSACSALGTRRAADEVVVATKGGLRMDGDRLVRDTSAAWLRRGVEASLENLRTDYIDLYQLHWPDLHTPAEETGRVLEQLVTEGKVRHVGVSNYDAKQIDELSKYGPVETLQPPYHMFHRDIEDELLPYAREHDIGVLTYGPLAHGMLGGVAPGTTFPADDWRAAAPTSPATISPATSRWWTARRVRSGERCPATAARRRMGDRQPRRPSGHRRARRPSELEGVLPAADITLTSTEHEEIDRILSKSERVAGPTPRACENRAPSGTAVPAGIQRRRPQPGHRLSERPSRACIGDRNWVGRLDRDGGGSHG